MSSVFIIAEAGVNHNGELERARELMRIAKDAGADAVKFQTFRAQDLVTLDAPAAEYQTRNAGATRQFDMLKQLELPEPWHAQLKAYGDELGIEFFSTPFSEAAVDLLVRTGVQRLKLPSGELTNKPLLEYAARTGLPLILSTGMGTLEEVQRAVGWVVRARPGPDPRGSLAILHCTSNYPAAPEALNLR
ncbi:MAG: N-acetylneuraminate synthase family protein, partial [Ramlibacter sp.]